MSTITKKTETNKDKKDKKEKKIGIRKWRSLNGLKGWPKSHLIALKRVGSYDDITESGKSDLTTCMSDKLLEKGVIDMHPAVTCTSGLFFEVTDRGESIIESIIKMEKEYGSIG